MHPTPRDVYVETQFLLLKIAFGTITEIRQLSDYFVKEEILSPITTYTISSSLVCFVITVRNKPLSFYNGLHGR